MRIERRALSGSAAAAASFAATIGIQVVQVGLLLHFWPKESYGAWLTIVAAASLLSSLDLGHQAYVGNEIARKIAVDREDAKDALGSGVRIALLTGGIEIAFASVAVGMGWVGGWLGLESGAGRAVDAAMVIYTVGWVCTGSVGSVVVRLYPPLGHFARSVWWNIGARVAQAIAVVAVAALGGDVIAAAIACVAVMSGFAYLVFADVRRLFPEFYPWWQMGSWGTGLRNLSRSFVFTGGNLLEAGAHHGLVLLVSSQFGASQVPVFTTLRTLSNVAMQGVSFLLQPIAPDIIRYHALKEFDKIRGVLALYWSVACGALAISFIGLSVVIEPVYRLWTHGSLEFDHWLFVALSAGVLVRAVGAPLVTIINSVNDLGGSSIVAVVRGASCILASFVLGSVLGLAGLGVAVILSEILGSVVAPLLVFSRRYRQESPVVPARSFVLSGLSIVIAVLVLSRDVLGDSWSAWVVICGAVAVMLLFARALGAVPRSVLERVTALPIVGSLAGRCMAAVEARKIH